MCLLIELLDKFGSTCESNQNKKYFHADKLGRVINVRVSKFILLKRNMFVSIFFRVILTVLLTPPKKNNIIERENQSTVNHTIERKQTITVKQ